MAAVGESTEPAFRFKRRKITHPRRVHPGHDAPTISTSQSHDAPALNDADAPQPPQTVDEDDDATPNLKEILRNRRRPRDRLREAARRAEITKSNALVQSDAQKQDQYSSRFVAQTGQVVDRDDKQMTEYIEARMAEKNYRLYGWPIPRHLEAAVRVIAPDFEHSDFISTPLGEMTAGGNIAAENATGGSQPHSERLAAGMGKLQEVDLGPDAAARNAERTEQAWKRMEGRQPEEEPAGKVRLRPNGKPYRRPPKRRNSGDIRRDEMVEAVLREAKLDYFEEDKPSSPPHPEASDNDDAMVERFRLEFLESIESRQQRKPVPPPGVKGVKELPKGPKMGGSRSARAKIHAQEDQAKKRSGAHEYSVEKGRLLQRDEWTSMTVTQAAWYLDS